MSDLNKEALAIWESLKPAVDKEIERKTAGTVQRRKVVVSTAPSSMTGLVGVQEPFGVELFVPYRTEVAAATVGDPVWIEFAYGANNAVAIGMASLVDTGTQTFDDVTITGTLDITPRRCYAMLSSAGWYRAIRIPSAYGSIRIRIQRDWAGTPPEVHNIEMLICYKNGSYSATWCNEESSSYDSSSVVIDKIRCTRSTLFDCFYVDIHYSTTASNVPVITFDASTTQAYGNNVIAESLQPVADSPAGETVLTTYSFAANTEGAAFTVSACGKDWRFEKRNGIVYFDAPYDVTTTSAGFNTITTLPSGWAPQILIRVPCANTISSGTYRFVEVSSSGLVRLYTNTAISSASNCSFAASWIAAK